MTQLSRREFAALAGATFAAPLAASQNPSRAQVSAQDVIDRIRAKIGVEWKPDSADGIKAGEASAMVKGIVTTSMATLGVLQRAVKDGSNLVFTGLPTFIREPTRETLRPTAAIGSHFRREEQIHCQTQHCDLSLERTLAPPYRLIRSRRAWRRRWGRRNISTPPMPRAQHTRADAGSTGRQCEGTLSICGRGSDHRRSSDTRAAGRVAARDDGHPGVAQDAARGGCHRRR